MNQDLKRLLEIVRKFDTGESGDLSLHQSATGIMRHLRMLADRVPEEPEPLMKLYAVFHTEDDGDDRTLFVRATDPERAAEFYRDWWRDSCEWDCPNGLSVRDVPSVEGCFGGIDWDNIPSTFVELPASPEEEF